MSESKVLTHRWVEEGLGEAPFRAVAIISLPSTEILEANPDAYNGAMGEACERARAYGVTLCSCYSCGMSLVHNVIIRDKAGKHFVVGMDCAARTHDTELISEAEALERARLKELREIKAEEERKARAARREAELAAERERNGGLTDWEVKEKAREDEAAAREARYSAENAWLLDVLAEVYPGDFVTSICRDLRRHPAREVLRGRAFGIVAEMYAKAKGGRKNSKAYKAAEEEFFSRLPEEE